MKTTLYLVRHGQSLGNLNEQMLGHTDLDLSELGYRQAAATFERLKDTHFDAVYSSPLQRAYNTVLPHAKHRGLTVVPLDALKEIYLGRWEGMYLADVVRRWPYTFWELWRANFGICTPPGGEYVQKGAARVQNALTEIARRHEGQTVLIGGHAGIFRAVCANIAGIPAERVGAELPYMTNASFSVLTYEGDVFALEKYSEDAHLESVGTMRVMPY